MSSVFQLLAPMGGAILLGVIAAMSRLFRQEDARVLARFVFNIAMPVGVFTVAATADAPGKSAGIAALSYLGGLIIAVLAALIHARIICRHPLHEAGAAIFAATVGNAIFLGLPIALSIPGWAPTFILLLAGEGIIAYTIAISFMKIAAESGGAQLVGTVARALGQALRSPVILAMLAGTSMLLLGIPLPQSLQGPLEFFSPIAAPMGLFVLGLYLVILPQESRNIPMRLAAGILPVKLVLFPAATMGLCWLLGGEAKLISITGLFTVVPPAVASIIVSANFRLLERQIATIVAIGTLIGLITVTTYLAIVLPA